MDGPKKLSAGAAPNAPKIDKDLVFAACEELHAEGRQVSMRTVVSKTGGSFTDVGQFVRLWKEERAQRHKLSLIDTPSDVEEAGRMSAKAIWKIASDLASQKLVDMGRQSDEQIAGLQAQITELMDELSLREEELHRQQEEFAAERAALLAKISDLTKSHETMAHSLAVKATELEISLAKYSDAQARIGELTSAGKELQTRLSETDSKLQRALVKSELDAESLKKAELQLRALAKENEQLQRKYQPLETQLLAAKNSEKIAEERALRAESLVKSLDEIQATLLAQNEEREREVKTLSERLRQLETQMEQQGKSVDAVRGELNKIRKKDSD